jgi:putative hydrolase of the HAD superfamily
VTPRLEPPRAVTFDYWDTLVRADPANPMRARQIAGFSAVLTESGHPRTQEALVEAFGENWTRFDEAWVANRGQYTTADSADFIATRLEVPLDRALRDRLVRAFDDAGLGAELAAAPDLEPCLLHLRRHGVRLAIVCDVGLTPSAVLRSRLEGLGLLRWFDAWSFSDETGRFKPAPEAFLAALEPLDVAPEDAAHVGDLRRTDVAGAKGLGMRSIRYRGFVDVLDGGPEADVVLDRFEDLPSVLGL